MKSTLITGTSTGIGKATAIHLARQGYHVYASMRNPTKSSGELTQIADEEGLQLDVVQLDVKDSNACSQIIEQIITKTGRIDVLVNNAGIALGGYVEEFSEELIRDTMETNFIAAMRLMQLVIPHMRQEQTGTIVNISSIMGRLARPGGSAYSASKWALEAASESLAQEVYRFNIRVALIEPGVVETPLHHKGVKDEDTSKVESPYEEFNQRGSRLFKTLLKTPSTAHQVAKMIQHAIETETPNLRYVVGKDAEKWAAGREAMTDEEWVNAGREMTLQEYVNFYRDRFDMEI